MKTLTLLILSLSAFAIPTWAVGPDVTGGGDLVKMRFQNAGATACQYLRSIKNPQELGVDSHNFCQAVDVVKVLVKDRTYLPNGSEVDALNFPTRKEIHLSLKRNDARLEDELAQLALHEYISVIGIDDTKFQVSGAIALRMGLTEMRSERPSTVLPTLEANYKCEPSGWDNEWPRPGFRDPIKVIFNGQQYAITNAAAGWAYHQGVANGQERLVSSSPPADGEEGYFLYEKARSMADGIAIEERGNNFNGGNDKDPVNRMVFYHWEYRKFTFSSDFSKMVFYSKTTQVNRKNQRRDLESRSVCHRVSR